MSNDIRVNGRVTEVFAHRFVIETAGGVRTLADIGPRGIAIFPLHVGMVVDAEGNQKPSELKVRRIAREGGRSVDIPHGDAKSDRHAGDPRATTADIAAALAKAGLEPLGAPRLKPKHVEVLARKGDAIVECHVASDGTIRKEKPVALDDPKWAAELKSAA